MRDAGDFDGAIAKLKAAQAAEPEHMPILTDLAATLAMSGDTEGAQALIASLPRDVRETDEIRTLSTTLALQSRASGVQSRADIEQAVAANPADLEARYQLSALQVLAGEHEAAMEHLLEMLRQDRGFRDDAGRKGLIEIFDLLGNSGPVVKRYRRLMASALH